MRLRSHISTTCLLFLSLCVAPGCILGEQDIPEQPAPNNQMSEADMKVPETPDMSDGSCQLDSDCAEDLLCDDGTCVEVECLDDTHCDAGSICEEDECVEDTSCEDDTDCDDDQICEERECVEAECIVDVDCEEGFICDLNECIEAPRCEDDSDCEANNERCDTMSGECVWIADDPDNCGAVGRVCPNDGVCGGGVCGCGLANPESTTNDRVVVSKAMKSSLLMWPEPRILAYPAPDRYVCTTGESLEQCSGEIIANADYPIDGPNFVVAYTTGSNRIELQSLDARGEKWGNAIPLEGNGTEGEVTLVSYRLDEVPGFGYVFTAIWHPTTDVGDGRERKIMSHIISHDPNIGLRIEPLIDENNEGNSKRWVWGQEADIVDVSFTAASLGTPGRYALATSYVVVRPKQDGDPAEGVEELRANVLVIDENDPSKTFVAVLPQGVVMGPSRQFVTGYPTKVYQYKGRVFIGITVAHDTSANTPVGFLGAEYHHHLFSLDPSRPLDQGKTFREFEPIEGSPWPQARTIVRELDLLGFLSGDLSFLPTPFSNFVGPNGEWYTFGWNRDRQGANDQTSLVFNFMLPGDRMPYYAGFTPASPTQLAPKRTAASSDALFIEGLEGPLLTWLEADVDGLGGIRDQAHPTFGVVVDNAQLGLPKRLGAKVLAQRIRTATSNHTTGVLVSGTKGSGNNAQTEVRFYGIIGQEPVCGAN